MAEYAKKLYGEIGYGRDGADSESPKPHVDLMKYLPPCWYGIKEMAELQRILGDEMGTLLFALEDVEKQLHLKTATWGLALWEKDYGIQTDTEKSDAFRRERIRAKMRGSGTTTKQQLINVASAFAGGEAEIIEHPVESGFTVKFVGMKGVPSNMADLSAAIEEIKPAHLSYDYAYTYNWWDNLKTYTWGSLKTHTWDQVKTI